MTPHRTALASLAIALTVGVLAGIYIVQQPGLIHAEPPGVSIGLARERAGRVSNLSYDVRLRIPDARDADVRGTLTARFTLDTARRPLVFDFAQPADRLLAVTVNGAPVTAVVDRGHVTIAARDLVEGANAVTFEFLAGNDPLNRQPDLLYSLFVPARASLAFPCFDQPDLKARWRLSLDVPRGWTAVANGREAGRVTTADHVGYLFDETEPLPTYLFAFAAGRFNVDTLERGGRTFRIFHRETDAARFARNRDALADQHAHALQWMEDYTAIPYPFGKFDIVLLPAFQFSGMEHPGAVFYNADTVLLDETATQNRLLARANVIAHETAHMWFGDLVTMAWFDDVWMKEVMANFMAAKIVNPSFPAMDHDLRFFVQHYPAAYDVDRTDGANPIRQPLGNLNDAGSLYGAIIYQKAPIVLRQLEMLMGADALREGLREYLSTHAFGNASWPDLVRALDPRTDHDLAAWSHAWIDEAGRPTLSTDLELADARIEGLTLRQSDARGRDLTWPLRLQVLLGYGSSVRTFDVTMDGATTAIDAAVGLPAPDWVLPLGGGLGYGDVDLDDRTLAFLTTSMASLDSPMTRAAAAVTRWEAMLDGQLPPSRVFDALLAELPDEHDELLLQLLLEQTRALFWRFIPASARTATAARLEPVLRTGLAAAAATSTKAAWFQAIRSTAVSHETVRWLDDVWARRVRISDLPLSETDETDLALDLAVRLPAQADAILAAQMARISDEDRRNRLVFIAPALSGNAAVRAAFFEGLSNQERRRREAWVVDAMRYLHHPLRADASRALVVPALTLLRELQRTGDIFLPKRWADATLSGYQTRDVAAEVQAFIDGLPLDYPVRLRWILLSSADPLFRAAALQAP